MFLEILFMIIGLSVTQNVYRKLKVTEVMRLHLHYRVYKFFVSKYQEKVQNKKIDFFF